MEDSTQVPSSFGSLSSETRRVHTARPSTSASVATLLEHQAVNHVVHGGGLFVGPDGLLQSEVQDRGNCFWPAGHRYTGDWSAVKPHGIGCELREGGESYMGEWSKGNPS
jgi:hypothetical protein